MLYDRLVIPIPPDGDNEEQTRWVQRGWDPSKQKKLLDILGDRAYEVPWTTERQEKWRTRFEAGTDFQKESGDYAFEQTRNVLTEGLPRYITGIQAVTNYNSITDVMKDLKLSEQSDSPLSYGTVIAILGHEFLVPYYPKMSHEDLLKFAIELSSEPIYKHKRTSFWRCQREFFNDKGITDLTAIEYAVNEIQTHLEEEKEYLKKKKIKTGLKYVFLIGAITLGLFGGPLTPVGIGSAFISVGQFATERLLNEPEPISLLHDIRRYFGWEALVYKVKKKISKFKPRK
ncbi:MAG: hypothetical protein HWN81_15110 [Candidatus Lokiarchaeota archaeon]|nr:hypothetical protein [Candidatus Lokiarchaeota archaeon]